MHLQPNLLYVPVGSYSCLTYLHCRRLFYDRLPLNWTVVNRLDRCTIPFNIAMGWSYNFKGWLVLFIHYQNNHLLNPLNPNIKIQILICYSYMFSIEVVRRISWSINKNCFLWSCPQFSCPLCFTSSDITRRNLMLITFRASRVKHPSSTRGWPRRGGGILGCSWDPFLTPDPYSSSIVRNVLSWTLKSLCAAVSHFCLCTQLRRFSN